MSGICGKAGCTQIANAGFDYCLTHAAGAILAANKATPDKRVKAAKGARIAFLKKARAETGDECVVFPFSDGAVGWMGKRWSATRLMCLWANGRAPDGMNMATHTCGNGHLNCVNPKHLAWGNAQTNRDDAVSHMATGKPDADAPTKAALRIVRAASKHDDGPSKTRSRHSKARRPSFGRSERYIASGSDAYKECM